MTVSQCCKVNSLSIRVMNSEQFSKYLGHLDHPKQLQLGPNVASLYFVYREHMTRFPYNNLDLYMGKPICDLSLDALLDEVPVKGRF